jgi:hypothetical protein
VERGGAGEERRRQPAGERLPGEEQQPLGDGGRQVADRQQDVRRVEEGVHERGC